MKKQPTVLAISSSDDPQLSMLAEIPHYLVKSAEALKTAPRDAEVILHWTGPRDLVRSAFLALPNLRWVHSRSAGLDSMLFPELVQSDIPVTNGTGVFSQSLGEWALAVILFFAKDIRRLLRAQEACQWDQFDVEELPGKTVGIVAYGDIGRAVASRVHGMGMRVLALKRRAPTVPDPFVERFYGPAELNEMLGECDFVVAAAPLTPETHHMISDDAFAAMRSNAVLINIGRGPVVDQAALVRALATDRIKGAGLDVFEQEPIPADDPIYKLPNVLISPHSADHTKDWLNQAMGFFLEQYQRFSSAQPLKNIVEKQLGY